MKHKRPNIFRCLVPLWYGALPAIAGALWLHVMEIVRHMAKLPPPQMHSDLAYGIAGAFVVAVLATTYQAWADFIRGDYYLDLALSLD